jgi:hypothetical protein
MADSTLYNTLPSRNPIRLLHLRPGEDNDRLSCSLEVVPELSTSPRYHALSYCWGDEKDLVELDCDGQTIMVTRNLYNALHRLHRETDTIWADAICINQADIAERNQQVFIMDEVYRHAFGVFIWTGLAYEETECVIFMIRKIVHRIYNSCAPDVQLSSWLSTLSAHDSVAEVVTNACALRAEDFPDESWDAFWRFYQAPWFFRVWVIQEVRRNSNIWLFCGALKIDWGFVALAATWIWHGLEKDSRTHWTRKHFASRSGFMNASLMLGQTFTYSDAPFLALLDVTRSFRSTYPRDKVFALLHHNIKCPVTNNCEHNVEVKSLPIWPPNVSSSS